MPRRIFLAALVAGAAALGVYWWLTATPILLAVTAPAYTPNPANGQTAFNAGGCSSCHAVPAQPDRLRLGGGLAIPSPFGTFYAPNISPDPVDGIGRWSEADFVGAVTRGISPTGFHYFPAFPYASYQHAKVDDVRDLFAYLKTLSPVSGKVRDHDVPFPFNVRRNIGIWKLIFMDGKPLMPDAAHSPQWNRGAYLVNSLGHCAECITQKGLTEWSAKDIAYFLETGQTPDGDTAGGAMVRVIKNTSQLTPEDRAAIAEYVKSLPPVDGPPGPKKAAKGDDKS